MKKILFSVSFFVMSILFGCSDRDTYYIKTSYADHIQRGTELFDRGIKIGYVEDLKLTANAVLLTILVSKDYKINEKTVWFLGTHNLTTRTINLNKPKQSTGFYSPGDTLKIELDFIEIKINTN